MLTEQVKTFVARVNVNRICLLIKVVFDGIQVLFVQIVKRVVHINNNVP
jgi:hypothetical protein